MEHIRNIKKPELKTEIPGPRSKELAIQKERYTPRGNSPGIPVYIARGEGAIVEDVDGNRLIDFTGGIGVSNVGYSSPKVVNAVKSQADNFFHTCFTVAGYEGFIQAAKKLTELMPGDFPKAATFFNSGAEAVENAVKIARRYTGRPGIIVFDNAFHGRTLLTMTMTSKYYPYKSHFGPFAPEIYRMPYAYCYRCSYGLKYPSCKMRCAHRLDEMFHTVAPADQIAAIVVEPLQGEGGFISAPKEFLQILREITKKNGIVFIDDEIQSGCGRTGKMFAIEHSEVIPDLITVAKSMAGGLPLSGVVGNKKIMDAPQVGEIGGTFGGNPVACAAAIEALDIISDKDFLKRATKIGEIVKKRFLSLKENFDVVGDVRGLGPMVAMEFVKDKETKEPNPNFVKELLHYCYKKGLLVIKAGTYNNVVRFLAPLVIMDEQLEAGLSILEEGIKEVKGLKKKKGENAY